MNKELAKQLALATRDALSEVAARFGLDVELGGGRYDSGIGAYTPKVTFKEPAADRLKWEREAPTFGLKPEWFGRELTYGGMRVRVIGINPRARRMAVIVLNLDDDRQYTASHALLARALEREDAPA